MRSTLLGFALGILLLQQQSRLWAGGVLIALLCAAVVIFLSATRIHQRAVRIAMLFIAGGLVGWIWASVFAHIGLSDRLSAELEERDLTVIGVITSLPGRVEYGQRFQFSIERVLTADIDPSKVPTKVLLTLYSANSYANSLSAIKISDASTLQPGERWQFKIRLRRPHGLANPHGFDYEVWLLEHGLGATGSVRKDESNRQLTPFVFSISNGIEWARGKLRDRILTTLPNQPYAPVIVALVIGEQNAITQANWNVFARTGVSHLIAISGLHITLLSGMFAGLMFYLWRKSFFTNCQLPLLLPAQKAAALAGVLMALLYVALAGFGVPAQRTLLMVSIAALACWFDRVASVTNVLCFALGAVLLMDPWAVLSPGFWLSFSAVGILFYVSLGRGELKDTEHQHLVVVRPAASLKEKLIQQLRQASVTQYAITLGLVPLTMLLFNQVSLVSPIANAVAIPVVSFLVTPFALVGSVLPAPLSSWLLMLTHFILQELVVLLMWLSELSWAVWNRPRPEIWMFICALIGTAWCLAPKGWPLRWAGILAWLPLCLNSSIYPPANQFSVTAFDVGQGTALLIETKRHRMLYDTGPRFSLESNAGSSVIYPYLRARGIHQLDGLMVSHSDIDHSGGALALLQQLDIGWVSSSLEPDSHLIQTASERSRHTPCLVGQTWIWDSVQFEILHPDEGIYVSDPLKAKKPNSRSCTLKITNGVHSILLAGDIEAKQERELIRRVPEKLQASVLLAPHHGSGTSSTQEFLEAVNPQIAIFQLGYHNRYKHPKSTIWQRYADSGITRLRTDQSGAITLNFADQISIQEYRTVHARYWYAEQDVPSDIESK